MSQTGFSPPQSMLPADLLVLERGWLSSNNILVFAPDSCDLVDSGYVSHASQTLQLVQAALGQRRLRRLLNTHLHSDHCGGNAAVQAQHQPIETWIPPGLAPEVERWREDGLSYLSTGQQCPRFRFTHLLQPGGSVRLGERDWQVHAAPGHDPDAVLLFEPEHAVLISADALWNNGFGVVFPELIGKPGFDAVGETLALIESLKPRVVIPGHGPTFSDVPGALERAQRRLAQFRADPARHSQYAAKALLKFKLLETQSMPLTKLRAWMQGTAIMRQIHARHPRGLGFGAWTEQVISDLLQSGAARATNGALHNT